MKRIWVFTLCLAFWAMGASASERCRDEVFFRRAHLTVTGALPSSQECIKFLNDNNPNKRSALVDRLLKSELGIKYMQMHWGDILRIKSEFPSNLWPNGVQAYNRWMLFLGNRNCEDNGALCFSQIKFKSTKEWKEEIIYLDIHKELPQQPIRLEDGTPLRLEADSDWRETYVEWLTSRNNRRFAEVMVNRMWYWVFGKGIVHEPDDWRKENKPSNPQLLNRLTDHFIKSGFNMRALMN